MSKAEMIACASVNYRLAQEAAFPAAVEDCKAAVRYLRANADKYGYKADPYYYIDKNKDIVADLAVWMIHGDCDLTIPYLSSVRLYDRLSEVIGQDGIHFRHEPDMGHASDPLYSDEILSEIDDFIRGDLS